MDRLELAPDTQAAFRQSCLRISLAIFLVVESVASAGDAAVATDVDGKKIAGTLTSWSADKLIIESSGPQEMSLKDIRSVAFDRPAQKAAVGGSMVLLSNGDRIAARPVSIAEDLLTVSWLAYSASDSPKIPLEKVSAVIFEMPTTSSERLRLFADLETVSPDSDLILLTNGDHTSGEFERLDAAFVEMKVAKRSIKLDRSRVRAIRFNPQLTNAVRATGHRSLLSLTDGSRITATNLELTNDKLTLKSSWLRTSSIPVSAVTMCQFFGGRVIPIGDHVPTQVTCTPYLSTKWPLARNRNVLYGPLVLRGTEYTTGLGTHSRMVVTYQLSGDERGFQSVVGIDDVAQGKGSVIFAVELDGRRVWTSSEITGSTPATNLPEISVQGSRQLTLIVEFGQFADVSDYADWCDAVLILDRSR